MKVIIDNVEYVPLPPVQNDNELLAALDVRFDSDVGNNITVRDYLRRLLTTLWDEQEGFSGKRPFGNSGWEYDVYAPLIKAGYIVGKLDDDGYIKSVNDRTAKKFVNSLILAMCYGIKP